jgi:hypothetical protein
MWDDEKVGLVKIYAEMEMEMEVGEWIGRGKRPPSAQSPGRHGRPPPSDGYIWASSLFLRELEGPVLRGIMFPFVISNKTFRS